MALHRVGAPPDLLAASWTVALRATQLLDGPYGYTYDANGNPLTITTPTGTTTFTWDGANQLTRIAAGETWEEYTYSAGGQRTTVTTPTGRRRLVYDGTQLVAEVDELGLVAVRYTGWPGSFGGLAAARRDSGRSYYHFDLSGHTRLVTDAAGNVEDSYVYEAFGQRAAGGAERFGYGGEYGYQTQPLTGHALLTLRTYDPRTGRFLNVDPVGFGGGGNLYGYCGNDPVNEVDPWGLYVNPPGIVEGLVPVWGSGRMAVHHFSQGHWLKGVGWTVMAALEAVPFIKLAGVATRVGQAGRAARTCGEVAAVRAAIQTEAKATTARGIAAELVHVTEADVIEGGRIGGAWGVWAYEQHRMWMTAWWRAGKRLVRRSLQWLPPNSRVGRWARRVPRYLPVSPAASQAFARPPWTGPSSALRRLVGVRSSPLGSVLPNADEVAQAFRAGEARIGGAFKSATLRSYKRMLVHQWLVDYFIDIELAMTLKAAGRLLLLGYDQASDIPLGTPFVGDEHDTLR